MEINWELEKVYKNYFGCPVAAQWEQLPPPNLDPAPSNECPFLGDFLGLLLLTGECVGCPPGPPRWVRAGLGGPDEEEDDDAAAV